ncbi:ParB/RepB/Spo0J family partition protein [Helicobacter cinaedi]|uniref:ParB/RepB/Spo0J family partition protein n=1 Tax=Helicobacter cinaedi TaxID=213 RepID=UPI000CF0AF45|nr:ParB/RepB/Spo0J family partition protein [Helicobacter cinaedi]AWK61451.1 ParB/RepB/Spo0J family partition protein [Helicobacter cinaedi]QOQ95556.1 ParB/RepB/Spo0J family partition protein [Helicobacter cinaedi]
MNGDNKNKGTSELEKLLGKTKTNGNDKNFASANIAGNMGKNKGQDNKKQHQKSKDVSGLENLLGKDERKGVDLRSSTLQIPVPKRSERDIVYDKNTPDLSHLKHNGEIIEVEIKKLIPNQKQMRAGYENGFFSKEAREIIERDSSIKELATSIKANGLLQPIAVYSLGHEAQVLYGHRRVLAHILLGETKIKAIPISLNGIANTDKDFLIKNISENLVREKLSPMEMARVFNVLLEHYYLKDIQEKLGISISRISEISGLIKLHPDIQKHIDTQKEPKLNTILLITLSKKTKTLQLKLFNAFVNGEMSEKEAIEHAQITSTRAKKKKVSYFCKNIQFGNKAVAETIEKNKEEFANRFDIFLKEFLAEKGFYIKPEIAKKIDEPKQETQQENTQEATLFSDENKQE